MPDLKRPDGDRTPTLTEVMEMAVEQALINMNTSMPGKFISYDFATQTATVQPLFKRTFVDGDLLDLPPIANVPVHFPRSGSSFIHFPIKAADPCFLVFSQRSLDTWKQSGDLVDPDDDRKFDLTDCIAFPGVSATNKGFAPSNGDDIILKNGTAEVNIKPDGKFKIGNGTEELLDLLDKTLDALLTAKVTTLLGPQPLIPPTLFTEIKSKLATIKG